MDDKYQLAIAYARDLGAEHGKNAASWVFDGFTTDETYARVLQGIEDGDPEILNELPAPDLSGQWAGKLTGPELINDAMTAAGLPEGPMDLSDICDAYEEAFSTAVTDELERVARYQTAKA